MPKKPILPTTSPSGRVVIQKRNPARQGLVPTNREIARNNAKQPKKK